MSYEADVRDTLEALVKENNIKPFEGRELDLVRSIILENEVEWDMEIKTSAKWWGEEVIEFVKQFLED